MSPKYVLPDDRQLNGDETECLIVGNHRQHILLDGPLAPYI